MFRLLFIMILLPHRLVRMVVYPASSHLVYQQQPLLLDRLDSLLPREDLALSVRVRHLLVLPRICEHPSVRMVLAAQRCSALCL